MKTPDELRKDFWDEDISIRGGVIYNQYCEIKDVIAKQDLSFAERKLEEIKRYAKENVPFYKGVTSFPVLTKGDILAHYEEHKSLGEYRKPIHISSTSGSTGTPFAVIQDYDKRMRNIADLKVFGELCEYPSHERMVFFRVINSKLHRTPEIEDKENIYYIDSSDLGEEHLCQMIMAVMEKKPIIIFSYSSTLIELAKYSLKNGLDPQNYPMKTVLTAGEGISEGNRKMVEKAFGCPVYRRYSDMELGILGQDKKNGSPYLLNWGSYYFECLKIDKDEPTEHGEAGRIVVTDLFNKAFPLIRYDTGDLGVMDYSKDEMPKLKEIFGRVRDCVYTTDGRLISPAKIFVTMWGTDNVKQWQFIQEDQNEYVMKLNCSGPVDESGIIEKFESILGYDANIIIKYTDEIPVQASNKRRAVICNYHKS